VEDNFLSFWLFLPIFTALVVSFVLSLAIVKTAHWHISRTARGHNGAEKQGIHMAPTPRVGGMAFFGGLLGASLVAPETNGHILQVLVLSSLPVFIIGGLEDLSISMSPRRRLLAAMGSAILAIGLTGAYVEETGIALLDAGLNYHAVAIAISVLTVAGMSHGFNLIDGLNGLAGGVAIAMGIGLAVIALAAGVSELPQIAMILIAASLGFLALNFPGGHLFLGDAGAYTLGFLLSFLAILLVEANPDISVIALVLCGFWPFIDTMAAILRRLALGRPVGEPDRLHIHHLMLRLVEASLGKSRSKLFINSLSSLCLVPLYTLPVVLGVLSYDNLELSIFYLILTTVFYYGMRFLILQTFRRLRNIRTTFKTTAVSH
jgi:UDP-N-acetylmuramyl pentapeptide phosphotransferase/UDP-N-acetylglucosamine-1-phosphate transferase